MIHKMRVDNSLSDTGEKFNVRFLALFCYTQCITNKMEEESVCQF